MSVLQQSVFSFL